MAEVQVDPNQLRQLMTRPDAGQLSLTPELIAEVLGHMAGTNSEALAPTPGDPLSLQNPGMSSVIGQQKNAMAMGGDDEEWQKKLRIVQMLLSSGKGPDAPVQDMQQGALY